MGQPCFFKETIRAASTWPPTPSPYPPTKLLRHSVLNKGRRCCCRSRRDEKAGNVAEQCYASWAGWKACPAQGPKDSRKEEVKPVAHKELLKRCDWHWFWRHLYLKTVCLGSSEACSELLKLQFRSIATLNTTKHSFTSQLKSGFALCHFHGHWFADLHLILCTPALSSQILSQTRTHSVYS